LSTIDKGPEHNTQKELADELGWRLSYFLKQRQSATCKKRNNLIGIYIKNDLKIKKKQSSFENEVKVNFAKKKIK